jgi:uncharacterized membrane protein YraQ (UPF0718 family)
MQEKSIKETVIKTGKSLWNLLPMTIGTILLVSLGVNIIPKSFYISLFENHSIFSALIGSLVGSISAGTPITSYIIGGELLEKGISLMAVTAFIVSWVTVGIIQFPIEAKALGKRFTFLRNLSSFVFSIIIAFIIVLILEAIK